MDTSAQQLKRMIYAALMAALTAAGAYIAIPISVSLKFDVFLVCGLVMF